jgi:hypothetical protein
VADLEETFASLRAVMAPFAKSLAPVTDKDGHLYLNTRHLQPNKKPFFFGAVQIKKGGVSFHLMPLYTHPTLLTSVSAELKKHMQGKSCFTFRSVEPHELKELAALTKAAFNEYKKAGYA